MDVAKLDKDMVDAATVASRPQREKKPTEKVKAATTKLQSTDEGKEYVVPPKYILPPLDPKWSQDPKEITKIPDHTKARLATGEKFDFFKLGTHAENRDKRSVTRAKRDPATGYFRAAEAPPFHARLSDEDHPLCSAEHVDLCFSKDMLAVTHERGHLSTRANVFAREGVYYYEAKLISISPMTSKHNDEPMIITETKKGLVRDDTGRGSVRLGFARREHPIGYSVGASGYSYGVCVSGTGLTEYGNARFASQVYKVEPKNPGALKEGDVVGLMITLPSLSIHQKVVKGTFNQAIDAPNLKCGPYVPKKSKQPAGKTGAKRGPKPKHLNTKDATVEPEISQTSITTTSISTPVEQDIIRDRVPFDHKKLIYFDSPVYAQHRDIMSPAPGKGRSINPETGTNYNLSEDCHPNHQVPHLRTLPGSKIEMWVNGEYQGIVREHLLAFLPPASMLDKTSKAQAISGPIDDGSLGYYPTVSTYGGGAVQVKFDEPFWFPPKDRSEAQPFGKRYNEQIIDDFVSDLIDEVCQEKVEKDFGITSTLPTIEN